jgi:hypothetical protein
MKDVILVAGMLGALIVVIAGAWIYFSPYHSCIRTQYAHAARAGIDVSPHVEALLAGFCRRK